MRDDDPKTRSRRFKGNDTMLPASDLLRGLMQNVQSPLSAGFTRLRLEVQWNEIVGPRIAKMTAPAAFEDGVLEVWVAHSTWMQELWFVKDDIKAKINRYLATCGQGLTCVEVRFTTNRRQAGEKPIVPKS